MPDLIYETARKIFAPFVDAPEQGTLSAALWKEIADAGFPLALLTEEQGGFGLGYEETFPIIGAAAAHSIQAPVAETMLANWILADAGLPLAEGMASFALVESIADAGETLARGVPWGGQAETLVLIAADGRMLRSDRHRLIETAANIAGEPRDTVAASAGSIVTAPRKHETYRALGAAMRVAGIAAAAAEALDLSVGYANERVQFGKPIGRNQAIQHQLAVMATQVAAAQAAADMILAALPSVALDEARFRMIAAAGKVRAGEAAGICAAIAHQVHGAIGFTREYRLNRLSRRLWSWRDEFGGEGYWADALGGALLNDADPDPWHFLTR